jgi:hypothetical protein
MCTAKAVRKMVVVLCELAHRRLRSRVFPVFGKKANIFGATAPMLRIVEENVSIVISSNGSNARANPSDKERS